MKNKFHAPEGKFFKRAGTEFVCELPRQSWLQRFLNKWRKPRLPTHREIVMTQYRDSIILADNRKRELWEIKKDINDQWCFQVIGRF